MSILQERNNLVIKNPNLRQIIPLTNTPKRSNEINSSLNFSNDYAEGPSDSIRKISLRISDYKNSSFLTPKNINFQNVNINLSPRLSPKRTLEQVGKKNNKIVSHKKLTEEFNDNNDNSFSNRKKPLDNINPSYKSQNIKKVIKEELSNEKSPMDSKNIKSNKNNLCHQTSLSKNHIAKTRVPIKELRNKIEAIYLVCLNILFN